MISITGIEFAAPPGRVGIDSLLAGLDPPDADQARRLGVDHIRTADGLSGHELGARAARAALARAGRVAEELDVLVQVPGRAPEAFLESELTRLQAALGARRALAVSVGDLGCASSSAALSVLGALLADGSHRRCGLLAMAAISPTPYRYRRPVTVNGDGGLAVLVQVDAPGLVLRDYVQETDGEYWDLFRIAYRRTAPEEWRETCGDEQRYSHALGMRSIGATRKLTGDLLARNGLASRDLAHVIVQNLSASSFAFYGQALGRPVSPVCAANLAAYGHLGPLDVFLNLRSLDGAAAAGDLVLVINNSPVAAWTAALFEKVL